MGLLSRKPAPKNKKYRIEKCSGCRKPVLNCSCNQGQYTRSKRGTPADQKTRVDQKANEWCNNCGCLVRNGRCANVTCKNH